MKKSNLENNAIKLIALTIILYKITMLTTIGFFFQSYLLSFGHTTVHLQQHSE